MIDPTRVTNYNCTDEQLEEFAAFCLLVTGKNAITTAKMLERLLNFGRERYESHIHNFTPFEVIFNLQMDFDLAQLLKKFGFGCYRLKSRGLAMLSASVEDLRTCSTEDLEKIPGISFKTSRFFILHTRKNAGVACLDRHILKYMKSLGYDVPDNTPQSKKKYLQIEQWFLTHATAINKDPAEWDLAIWVKNSGH